MMLVFHLLLSVGSKHTQGKREITLLFPISRVGQINHEVWLKKYIGIYTHIHINKDL